MAIISNLFGKRDNRHMTKEDKAWDKLKKTIAIQNQTSAFMPGNSLLLKATFHNFQKEYERGRN